MADEGQTQELKTLKSYHQYNTFEIPAATTSSEKKRLSLSADGNDRYLDLDDTLEKAGCKEDEEPPTTLRLSCFLCLALSAFLGDASRGLVVPSIVPFLYQTGASSSFVGYVNGAYSAGRLIAAPLFGFWAEKRSFREAVLVNLIFFFVGNIMYAMSGSEWVILVSRILVGLGSGTLGLARGYIAQTTCKADRTQWMTYLTIAQFIGYSVTPGIGALLSFADISILGDDVEFDAFTAPGYVMGGLAIGNMLMMKFAWVEPAAPPEKATTENSISTSQVVDYLVSFTGIGVLLYVLLQFVTRMVVAVYETLSQLIAINDFQWGIFTLGMVSCAFGIVGTIVLLAQKPLGKRFNDENLLFLGLFSLGIGYAIFTPWLGSYGTAPLGIELTEFSVGSLFIFGVGFPITQALLVSLFSKLLGPIPQSMILGWIASLGSLARIVGAVVAGWAFQSGHTRLLLLLLLVLLLVPTVALYLWHAKRRSNANNNYKQ